MGELDDVVSEEVKEEVSPQAEETTPSPDANVETVASESDEKHPLQPGGDRFKQVYARAKKAEEKLDHLSSELQREREERIRMEERLKAKEEQRQEQAEPEYTWDQLEAAIADGKITLRQAQEHREKVLMKKAEKAFEEKLATLQKTTNTEDKVVKDLDRYKQSIPDIMTPGSESRQKYEREYMYLKSLGHKDGYATQLIAARAAFGDVETVEKAALVKKTTPKETFMETNSTSNKPQKNDKDPLKNLSERERKHYEKMIDHGHYKDWKEVAEELAFVNPFARRA